MSTQKRRIIYVSDEEWATWRSQAAEEGRTVSDWVRFHVVDRIVLHDVFNTKGVVVAENTTTVNPADRFNTRPFTPVPKK